MTTLDYPGLTVRVRDALDAWDATDEPDTDLGVEIENLGREVAGLLRDAADGEPHATACADELAACAAHYESLAEHDTNASLDIADRLPAAVRMLGILS